MYSQQKCEMKLIKNHKLPEPFFYCMMIAKIRYFWSGFKWLAQVFLLSRKNIFLECSAGCINFK